MPRKDIGGRDTQRKEGREHKPNHIEKSEMISSDPRLPVGKHPLAGGGTSLPIISDFFYIIQMLFGVHCLAGGDCDHLVDVVN